MEADHARSDALVADHLRHDAGDRLCTEVRVGPWSYHPADAVQGGALLRRLRALLFRRHCFRQGQPDQLHRLLLPAGTGALRRHPRDLRLPARDRDRRDRPSPQERLSGPPRHGRADLALRRALPRGYQLVAVPLRSTRRCAPGLGRRFRAERAAWPDARRLRHGAGGRHLLAPTVTRRRCRRGDHAGWCRRPRARGGSDRWAASAGGRHRRLRGLPRRQRPHLLCLRRLRRHGLHGARRPPPLGNAAPCPLADQHPGLPNAGLLRGRQRGPAAASGTSRSQAALASRCCPR